MPHILWILRYEEEIEADFLRFYGVYDYEEVESKKFLRLATRLPFYEGAVLRRYQIDNEDRKTGVVASDYDRKKLYKNAGVENTEVTTTGPDYLAEKLKGPTL